MEVVPGVGPNAHVGGRETPEHRFRVSRLSRRNKIHTSPTTARPLAGLCSR
jgi:hypothetical protein